VQAAIVHDWLPVYAGAERVLERMLDVVPKARLFSLFDFLPEDQRAFLGGRPVETSFMQRLPLARRRYRNYLPLAPLAIEQFDLSGHEVVISSSYVVAKGVLTTPDQLHVSYVHSPVRYAWDLQFQYLREQRMERGLKSALARSVLHYLRVVDAVGANRVDVFLANSDHVARRIRKTYRRDAAVVYPPVDTEAFALYRPKEDYYVTLSRLVPYKRVDLLVRAFTSMPDRELVVIGDGPELRRLRAMAGPNVTLLGYQPFDAVRHYLQRARAFVYGAEEDFGITAVEAQACGTPVIGYGRGGLTETVIPGETGVLFPEQSVPSLVAAVERFEREAERLEPERVRANAERFSVSRFHTAFGEALDRARHGFITRGPAVLAPLF
jgi:glycosyltransferase involved in cell wall biosynthesis